MPTASRAADRGAVTVEAALALAAFVVVLAMALAGIVAVSDQLRCTDAAREAARLVARGEAEKAREAVDAIAPGGASLDVRWDGDRIRVHVAAEPVTGLLPGVRVSAEAFAVAEPGVTAAGDGAR
ncbi:TadE-like protein [Herbihabitans rhizosphaerae]|uniref:TadE-like protein n=1 Tax=Herbihabitans rhizosphaerae TaxID=1872711 RepID=A0A4Q7KX93_9PSEU|nr:TadE family type IV pilus minor pilin [Herbihabitans rhizosphaerae]RZS41256.1 TadE-like protein [Herbihabitans rhizosphaerae]